MEQQSEILALEHAKEMEIEKLDNGTISFDTCVEEIIDINERIDVLVNSMPDLNPIDIYRKST